NTSCWSSNLSRTLRPRRRAQALRRATNRTQATGCRTFSVVSRRRSTETDDTSSASATLRPSRLATRKAMFKSERSSRPEISMRRNYPCKLGRRRPALRASRNPKRNHKATKKETAPDGRLGGTRSRPSSAGEFKEFGLSHCVAREHHLLGSRRPGRGTASPHLPAVFHLGGK